MVARASAGEWAAASIGVALRLNRLRNPQGFIFLLAADHRLSRGDMKPLADLGRWYEIVDARPELSGIVVNPGQVERVPRWFSKEVVPQVMGSPPTADGSLRKVLVGSVAEAVRNGANLISLQMNFEDADLREQVECYSRLRTEAAGLGIPVLTMINLRDRAQFDASRWADYVTFASELGSDLIKVALPHDATQEVARMRSHLAQMPPTLLSGDPQTDSFLQTVQLSRRCGYSGLCIGRNIFDSTEPREVVGQICAVFATPL